MKAIKQLIQVCTVLVVVSVATGLTYLIKGEPNRYVKEDRPDQTKVIVPEGYISIDRILDEYGGKVIWVDARSRSDWQYDGVKGSLFISSDPRENTEELIEENSQALFEAEQQGIAVVIYCNASGCSDSGMVKKQLMDAGFELPIFLLHGGYSAITHTPHILIKKK